MPDATVALMTVLSLTRPEAESRARLLTVSRYDIDGRPDAVCSTARSGRRPRRSRFTCSEPGATTFVDAVGEIVSATLNGVELDLATVADGRMPLPDLQADERPGRRPARRPT